MQMGRFLYHKIERKKNQNHLIRVVDGHKHAP